MWNVRRACANCRNRKIRCDEVRPVCGQCTRRGPYRGLECEYSDHLGRTPTEVLEDQIYELENKIQELEDPKIQPSSIRLSHPYSGPHSFSPGPSRNVTGSSVPGHADQDLPLELRKSLLALFLSQSFNVGFFLNPTRFWQSALSNLPPGHPDRPTPSLLNTVYLLAFYLSRRSRGQDNAQTTQQIQLFLSHSLQQVSTMLNSTHPHRVVHGIQAEVLLSTYFFDMGKIVEGKYHLSAAVSLAIGVGLHRIRSDIPASSRQEALPPPRDSMEEGERINAFWTVYMLSNVWGAVEGSSGSVFERNGSSTIDTPWPLDVADYEQYGLPSNLVGNSTVHKFLLGSEDQSAVSSANSLNAQASILLERAASLTSRFHSNMLSAEERQAFENFNSLDNLIDTFIGSRLPPMDGLDPTSRVFGAALLTHTFSYVSCIQLHSLFCDREKKSMVKSLAAVEACIALLGQARNAPFISPVMAMLWMNIAKVIFQQITRLRQASRGSRNRGDKEGQLVQALKQLGETLRIFGESSVLMRNQYMNLQSTTNA
ncbi:hypothetical protein E1B28_002308 [Marasmius oreades]|uniref:Zn(2)-C6 fungal-type domain-containing protein n=1 Tax=Marasmius oreades TaxID=181124 RepID=A0A9P7RN30_9AGAR|nr:uncharacterized protein E1B28_002308 [Marasmius oreades]KAG7086347.1 hypothetical protein E1B28_002308 [Marasmius oreades]